MRYIDKIIGLLAPHYCLVCGFEGTILCQSCYLSEFVPHVSECFGCNKATFDFEVCPKCRAKTPISRLRVALYLDPNVQKLIYKLKFGRAYACSRRIAEILDDTSPPLLTNTHVTYVPSSPSRIRARGYDHSRLIAQNFARIRGLDCKPLLLKTNNSRQVGANKKQRLLQANSSYIFKSRGVDKNRPIVLIDDISTTGATLGACTRILIKAGYKDVSCMVLSKK